MEPIELIVVKGDEQSPRNSEGDIVELLDGRLLLAWTEFYGSSGGDHDLARISGKISSDRGRAWSDRFTIVDSEGAWRNCMEPDFQRLPSGELLLFYIHKNSRLFVIVSLFYNLVDNTVNIIRIALEQLRAISWIRGTVYRPGLYC